MILFRSIIYYVYLFISTLLFSLLIVLSQIFFKRDNLNSFANYWGKSNIWVLKTICGLGYKIVGMEHFNRSNCIVMCKHQSAWETIALRGLLPSNQSWVLKQELIKIPFFGSALRTSEPIAIDRSSGRKAVKQVIRQGREALEKGRWVIIFPEGTRVAPGTKKKYGIGGALLAEKSKYPVIPIAHNAGVYWKRRSLVKYPGTIQVVVGSPIDTKEKRAKDIINEVEKWIESQMENLPSNRAA